MMMSTMTVDSDSVNEYYECSDDTMPACDDDIFMEVPSNDKDLWASLNHEERAAYSYR
jgi:hypothetical protein